MHVCSDAVVLSVGDDLEWLRPARTRTPARAIPYNAFVDDGAIYRQPFSEGGAALQARCVRHRGKTVRGAGLSLARSFSLRLSGMRLLRRTL